MGDRGKLMLGAMVGASLMLAACGREPQDKSKLAGVDQELTGEQTAALKQEIIVDPKKAAPNAAVAEGAAREALGGKILAAPAAKPMEECTDCAAAAAAKAPTLGELAADPTKGKCDARLTYGNDWAARLPAAFTVYPRALVREAAGVAGGMCNIRVVNFRTAASKQAVLNYYHTLATRAGYTSDHRVDGAEHMLGGTKGDLAYVVMLRSEGGQTDVDLVASGGR
jgi:outer membrane murein-binding lipoprotein Lpp